MSMSRTSPGGRCVCVQRVADRGAVARLFLTALRAPRSGQNGSVRTDARLLVVAGPAGVGKSTTCHTLARAWERSVHLQSDEFSRFVVNGWVDQWRPEAAAMNEAIGTSIGAAAIQFVVGGYTTLLDGHGFPEGFDGLASIASMFGVTANYVVLRADYETCRDRATSRGPVPPDELMKGLHDRFQALGPYEQNVVDASGDTEAVAASVLAALDAGALVPRTA